MIGRRRVHVDDRAAHGHLAACLHLVLAPVAHRHELVDEPVAVELLAGPYEDRFEHLDVRAEPLDQRTHGRDDHRRQQLRIVVTPPQPPDDAHPTAHSLDRGRDPLERQRLPRREELHRVGAHVLAEVGRQPFRLDAGGDREYDGATRGVAGERRGKECARGFRDRDRPRAPGRRGGDDRVGPEQRCEPGEGRLVSHGERAIARDARAPRGFVNPQTTSPSWPFPSPIGRCSDSSRPRRLR